MAGQRRAAAARCSRRRLFFERHGEARDRLALFLTQRAITDLHHLKAGGFSLGADVGFAVPVAMDLGLLPAVASLGFAREDIDAAGLQALGDA